MKNVIVSLVVGWFVFWVCLWVERGGPFSLLSGNDLPGPVIVATLAGLANWAGITAWPRVRERLARRRALRESPQRALPDSRAAEPKRWKRVVGWGLVFAGVSEASRTLTASLSLTEIFLTLLWFWWGTWWIVSNPPEDGYLIARLWDSVRSAVHR